VSAESDGLRTSEECRDVPKRKSIGRRLRSCNLNGRTTTSAVFWKSTIVEIAMAGKASKINLRITITSPLAGPFTRAISLL